jgi:L-threonylcarbamoyladenylate synthase
MVTGRVLQQEILEAVETLRAGELVAFPTETVYGLGANANNPDAVRKIFRVKGRPSTNPVIVHIDHPRYLQRWVREMSPEAKKLADAFWPGPLTLVAKRAPAVNDVITGGQDTVAIRVPNHPVAQQLLNAFGGGIAAPSANRYGHVSPTRAEHVRDEFGEEVKIVLDGGDCKVGLESTIVSCVGDAPRVLRPGSISLSQLRAVVPSIQMGPHPTAPRVPGTTARHYSPTTPVNVVPSRRLEQVMNEFTGNHEKVAVLAQRPPITATPYMTWINAGTRPDLYGRQLYTNLRTLDKAGARIILVEEVPAGEKWDAVRDRLRRAATAENIVTYDQDIAAWVADFGEEGGPA